MTSVKTCWSILQTLLNYKKVFCIHFSFHQNKYVTDFKKKAELYNCFFAKYCSMKNISSELSLNLFKKKSKSISIIIFISNDTTLLIQQLEPNKTHGRVRCHVKYQHAEICGKSICEPFDVIFQSYIKHGKFTTEWKQQRFVLFLKKSDKQALKNYSLVSLFPKCEKIFERLLNNSQHEYSIENDFFSPYQCGFKSGNLCINHLLFITHDIKVRGLGVISLPYLNV